MPRHHEHERHRHEHSAYKPARFHFTEPQLHKIHKGHKVRLAHDQIGKGPHTLFLHPVQHHKVSMAHAKGKGVDLEVSDGELMHSMESGAQGTGVWDSIKAGFNKYVKPVLSTVGDIGANALSYTNPEFAPVIQGVREGVRGLTGVGLRHKKHKKAHKKHHYESDTSSSESEHEHKRREHKPKRKVHRKSKKGSGLYL